MAYTLAPYDERQYFDDNGDPLAFGKVNTYTSGTSTPVFTFADSTGTLNTNPVVLSASGRARIYLDPLLAYKFIVTDANDVPVGLTMDPVSLNQATLAANVFQASTRGTVGATAFSFTADTDTGIFSSAANTLDVSTNGAQRARFYPTGGVSVGDTTDPGALNVRVAGAIYLVGSAAVTANALENRSGSLYFNNVALATGSSVSGTSGKLAKFTGSSTIGDSIVTESGTTVTVAGTIAATLHSGSGASLTALPAGNLSGTIASAVQDLITRLSTIVSGIWNAGAVTSTGKFTTSLTSAGAVFSAGSATTALQYIEVANTSGYTLIGTENSTGGSFAGTSANASLVGSLVAKPLQFLTGAGGTVRATISATGDWTLGGTAANITDGVGTPTIASGFSGAPTIAGKSYAFVITCTTGGSTNIGTVNFGTTYANAPIVTVSDISRDPITVNGVTTTQLTLLTSTGNFTNGNKIYVLVRGY